jgi:hypothetical protein
MPALLVSDAAVMTDESRPPRQSLQIVELSLVLLTMDVLIMAQIAK